MIEFEGNITTALLRRAKQRDRSRFWLIAGVVLVLAGIAGFLAQPAPLQFERHGFMVVVATIGGVMVTRALAKPDEIPEVHIRGSVSEQRLSIITPQREEHLQWTSFSAAILGDDYVQLQQSPFFSVLLGREFFRDAASWEEFRALVTRNVRVKEPITSGKTVMWALLWLGIFALALVVSFYFTRPA